MAGYARPRISIVIDQDVYEALQKLAEKDQRPLATYAAMIFSDLVRQLSAEEGQPKKHLTTSHKT